MAPLLVALLRCLGFQIGKYPLAIFLTNLLVFLPCLSYFLLFDLKIETDVRRGFAHRNGRAAKELEAFGQFYNVTMDGLEILLVFLEAKEPAAQLPINSEILAEVDRLDRFIKDLAVELTPEEAGENNTDQGEIVRLEQLQTARGDVNFLLRAYKWAQQRQEAELAQGRPADPQIQLKFPVSRIYGFDVPLNSHFFGVKSRAEVATSNRADKHASLIESAQCITLWYMFEGRGQRMRDALASLEQRLFEHSKSGQFSTLFDIHLYADEIANFEMMRGSQRTHHLLSIGIGSMVVFMLITFWDYHWKSQLLLISMALLSPSLAIAVTFALLGWLGIHFNAIMSIMPFLVFGIGVDNAFLLLHSWRKWSRLEQKQMRKTPNMPERMARVVAEMGPSIGITSLTNGLAFGIGIFSPSSLMASFCLCTTIAIFLDFLFEFLLFAPCLPLIRWKMVDSAQTTPTKMRKLRLSFCRAYARFIVSRWAKLCTFALLFFAYLLAFFGISRMEATFEPQKMFSSDSPLQRSMDVINRVAMEHAPISMLVFRPPNITDPNELGQFNRMVSELEALPNTRRIELWLRDYLQYDRLNFNRTIMGENSSSSSSAEYRPSYGLVPRYLREHMMEDKRIVGYREYSPGNVSVDNFVFVLSRWGDLSWHQRAFFVDTLRTIVDHYPRFNVTVFDYDSTIYDLILTVKTELLKAVLVTLTCMALVCFFVIPNLRHTTIATFSVLSISFTLMGALGWWGLELDPVTMINALMGIGFSVDFSAHICYHFDKMQRRKEAGPPPIEKLSISELEEEVVDDDDRVVVHGGNAQRQIEAILNAVGRPMLEAAISTVICVFPLFFLPIYIIAAFARTVLCVGTIGIVHGLFIVPVLLSMQIGQKCEDGKNVLAGGADDNCSSSTTTAASSQQQTAALLPAKSREDEDGDVGMELDGAKEEVEEPGKS